MQEVQEFGFPGVNPFLPLNEHTRLHHMLALAFLVIICNRFMEKYFKDHCYQCDLLIDLYLNSVCLYKEKDTF